MKGRELFRKKKIPQPSIKREDLTARILSAEYDSLFTKLGTQASLGPYAVLHQLHELMGERGVDVERLRKRLNVQFVAETRRIIADLIEGGDEELVSRLASLALPAQEVFGQKIRYIRELYLNDAVERIKGEEDDLKKAFLKKLTASQIPVDGVLELSKQFFPGVDLPPELMERLTPIPETYEPPSYSYDPGAMGKTSSILTEGDLIQKLVEKAESPTTNLERVLTAGNLAKQLVVAVGNGQN